MVEVHKLYAVHDIYYNSWRNNREFREYEYMFENPYKSYVKQDKNRTDVEVVFSSRAARTRWIKTHESDYLQDNILEKS